MRRLCVLSNELLRAKKIDIDDEALISIAKWQMEDFVDGTKILEELVALADREKDYKSID